MRAFVLSLLLASAAHAGTIPVTSPTDEVDTNGLCSLREAVQAATTDAAVDACPAGEAGMDRIEVGPGLGTLVLALGEIVIDRDVEIAYIGSSGGFRIDAKDTGRIFHITGGTVRLVRLGFQNGWAENGGAILAKGTTSLALERVGFSENIATNEGADLYMEGGTLTITDGQFRDGIASENGGALALHGVTATLSNVRGGGTAGQHGGFAYIIGGTLIADDVEAEFSLAGGAGGALFLSDADATITTSRFAHNDAVLGGAIAAQRSTLAMNVLDMEFNDAERGGAIAALPGTTLTVERAEIDQNWADSGAGFFLDSATATLIEVLFDINEGTEAGGGIYARLGSLTIQDSRIGRNYARLGAGLFLLTDATITGSLIRNNMAETDIGIPAGEMRGGGIYVDGGSLALVNSTLSGNQTLRAFDGGADSDGGALHVREGDVRVESVTIVGNAAVRDGGGISREGGTLEIKNSIVSGNTASGVGADCKGEIVSMDHNLIQDTDGCTLTGETGASLFGVDPDLGPLANNGGFSASYMPSETSPAVNAGMTDLLVDQRGYLRDAMPDIGAIERGAQPPVAIEQGPGSDLTLTLAPNPVRTTVAVTFRAQGDASLTLFDMRGRLVATLYAGRTTGEQTVVTDVRDLAPGVYLLRLGTEAGVVSRALVVAR